jgi:hypothetical protein
VQSLQRQPGIVHTAAMAKSAAWQAAEQASLTLGLPMTVSKGVVEETNEYLFEGQVDGLPMRSRLFPHARGAFTVQAVAMIAPRFDLGVEASVAGADLYAEPHFGGDDLDRVRALLDERVMSLLKPGLAHLAIYDDGIVATLRDVFGEWNDDRTGAIVKVTQAAHELRRQVLRASSAVPVAAELSGHEMAWAALALPGQSEMLRCPLSLLVSTEQVALRAVSVRRGPGAFGVEIEAVFTSPLGIGLQVHPQGLVDRIATLLGGQDLLLGDDAFDRAFVVRAKQQGAAIAALSEEARKGLQELSVLGAVEVDDQRLRVVIPEGVTAEDSSRAIEAVATVSAALAREGGGALASPYR